MKKHKGTTISVAIHKGGTGKTTTAVNLAYGLNDQGKRVLIVDVDAQANSSLAFGHYETDGCTLYDAISGACNVQDAIKEIRPGLHLIPSNLDLAGLEVELMNKLSRETILKRLVDGIKHNYDYIILDCAPSLGLLPVNCLTASDYVLLPVTPELLGLSGLSKFLEFFNMIKSELNPALDVLGILLTRFDSRKLIARDTTEIIKQQYANKVLKTAIRENVALSEAVANQQSIFDYNVRCNGAVDYTALTKEIIKLTK